MDFSKYFNADIEEDSASLNVEDESNIIESDNESISVLSEEDSIEINEENVSRETLSPEVIKDFCERFSGELPSGESKAVISYQSYKTNTNKEYSMEAEQIYQLSTASVLLSYDIMHPDLLLISLKFDSYNDPALRLFWNRLRIFRNDLSKNLSGSQYDIPIFLLHLIERESLGALDDDEANPNIYEANIINPLICYITRESPTSMAIEEDNGDEKLGGNVVKMLVSLEDVDFVVRNDIDVMSIKAYSMREAAEERYENV